MATHRSWPRVFDAHCHLHDPRLSAQRSDVLQRATAFNVTYVATCACFEEDWTALDELLAEMKAAQGAGQPFVDIVPAFGIHPWWANAQSDQYLDKLRAKLDQYPRAALGEIGLCKSNRGRQVDRAVQERVFREQLELAAELGRPCVLHCVGVYGKLLEILQSVQKARGLPPAVVLHSYSGAPDMIPAFLALQQASRGASKLYFSLNAKQLSSQPKAIQACTKVPLDALLLETDAPDQALDVAQVSAVLGEETIVVDGLNEPAMVQLALIKAAEAREMSTDELASAVFDNTVRAFRVSV
ncbi:hypothetical protein Poli38472_008648 [Pythium oligandrum]|uniref:TatD related DNase n=1 Tax=Pythium oligandrum TaxID=41045 RepID=A0A8K1C410_PYTOL|nr:hypothetical protein Poli38472_008648 [Pythium oligandrum]|eukprot:TMW56000.1 hypothetical protein Poli38472_008648 [Pythium oligandrum]